VNATLVIPFGRTVYLFTAGSERPTGFRLPDRRGPARAAAIASAEELPGALVDALDRLRAAEELHVAGEALARTLAGRTGRRVVPPTLDEWRLGRRALPPIPLPEERAYVRSVAAEALGSALRAPEEVLITLAREEERLERAVGREQRASEAMLEVPDSPLVEYLGRWAVTRAALERHHRALVETLESTARSVAPNLAAVVGPRVAARLIAAAGGLGPLGRTRGARLQLLGSRRRPSADRGPRFGVIYRAERMTDVPADRRGAYARSLAALASIAARADATTRSSIAPLLLRRRDRRVEQLRGRRR